MSWSSAGEPRAVAVPWMQPPEVKACTFSSSLLLGLPALQQTSPVAFSKVLEGGGLVILGTKAQFSEGRRTLKKVMGQIHAHIAPPLGDWPGQRALEFSGSLTWTGISETEAKPGPRSAFQFELETPAQKVC